MLREDVGKRPLGRSLEQLKSNPLPPSISVYPDDPDNLDSIQAAITPPGPNGQPRPISPAIEKRRRIGKQLADDIRDGDQRREDRPPGDRGPAAWSCR